MGHVRPFAEGDIPQVIHLHQEVFPIRGNASAAGQTAYRLYFQEIFLKNPWRDAAIPSLVYEETNGQVVGFLGVMPRLMSIDGRPVRAAISSQFMIAPSQRSTLAAVELVKAFLAGPQDLSLADEAGHSARRFWESLGGTTALLYSINWTRLLRPARFAISQVTKRTHLAPLAAASIPLCRLLDAFAAHMPGSPLRQRPPASAADTLDSERLLGCLAECGRRRSLRPAYDEHSFRWLLEVLEQKEGCGSLQRVGVRDGANEILGAYLYYRNAGGVGEVLHVGAKHESFGEVLDHLFYHAWRGGVTAVSGRLDPRCLREFSEKGCFFHHRGQWMLVHARQADLLQAIHRGDALLTRLEGEWCMRFRGGYG